MRYAITDIHGCNETFRRLLADINFGPDDELFLLGDYIDRGPDSMGTLETIWKMIDQGLNVVCLRGNHEQMLIDYADGKQSCYDWSPAPGRFKFTVDWFRELPYYHETPGYLLVHAGLNFDATDPLADTDSMLWARGWYDKVDKEWLGERILLHGHTPAKVETIQNGIYFLDSVQRLCLDAGCCWDKPGLQHLAAFNLDNREIHFLKRKKKSGIFSW